MNSIEEQLWSYIDGTCTADESAQISQLLLTNEEYKQQYVELLTLHSEFATIELDEPPMAFTYHVMEQIRTQEALVPLKSVINKRIIYGVAAFFIITITTVLIYALGAINWGTASAAPGLANPIKVNVPAMSSLLTGPWMKGFLFFDTVLGLFLLDAWLRKKSSVSQGEPN